DEAFSSAVCQGYSPGRHHEIGWPHLAVVDGRDHARVRDQWSERFHHVERERRLPVPQLMVEASIRIEADRGQRDGPAPKQQRVSERQQRIDGIDRWLTITCREVESEALLVGVSLDDVREGAEIPRSGGAFYAEKLL